MAAHALFVAPFGELADPRLVARLAAEAEEAGWDGLFLWDHIAYDGVRDVADPWVTLSAIACATERLRLGPLVTPLARRRPQKVARETVTLDHLSGGRLVFGTGLGGDRGGELSRFGEELDARERAKLLDARLDELVALWGGGLAPAPVQRPRIPVWLGAKWPNRRPVRRAARWDGLFPVELPGPDALAELVTEVRAERGDDPYDFVVTNAVGTDPAPWEAAGASWCLTGFGKDVRAAEVRAAAAGGPPR